MTVSEAHSIDEISSYILEQDPTEDTVVLGVHGTDYLLELTPTVTGDAFPAPRSRRNRRIRGTISGWALKMHRAEAGGRFIEPVHGTPRIVQGTVYEVDAPNNRLLMDVVVPMWITLDSATTGQFASQFAPGDLLNFYLAPGTSFTPA
ncbi:MAG: hypothetical protein VXY94_10875 [Planctomycetota bacterium]|nr:hypothetical protein [Planctomycetota bacterium]MEC8735246.1 hypothetical protein [Planctomycetota bacterium]MEC8817998.1 hypothetical protein [Planctomycetota bacterium]MEC9156658.1 hypothetical protein [Planctomycetota bacterium]MEC9232725.1 hypothetical protein [Planctomycetota bacterium]